MPRQILSIPIDNNETESTVTMKSAERVRNPNDKTREDNKSDIIPHPICTERNQLRTPCLSI
jgi:hypothetical protein